MKIDLYNVRCRWINLDSATKNAQFMTDQMTSLGIKNHERFSARMVPPPEGTHPSIQHYRGCAQSHIDILRSERCPLLILEDDAKHVHFQGEIEVPDDTDAVYLGVSHGNRGYLALPVDEDWMRISGVLATQSILYLTDSYREAVADMAEDFVYNKNTPFDVGCAALQESYKVITPTRPWFVQADESENANKWESLTNKPLERSVV
jgi:hypothetical protein